MGPPLRLSRLAGLLALAALLTSSAIAQPGRQRRLGERRLIAPEAFRLLELADPEAWQRPDEVMDALGIADGATVADVGVQSGWFTLRLARRVGPEGLVYAVDSRADVLESVTRRLSREGLSNVRALRASLPRLALPDEAFDAVLIVNAYAELNDPVAVLRRALPALKPSGRLGVVDFRLDGGGPGPPLRRRTRPEVVLRHARQAGLRAVGQHEFLPYQYLLVFQR